MDLVHQLLVCTWSKNHSLHSTNLTSLKVSKLATHNIGIIWTPVGVTTNCSPCLIYTDLNPSFIGSGSIYQSNFTIRAVGKFSGNGCMYRMAQLPELKQALPPQYSKLTKSLLGVIIQCQPLSKFPCFDNSFVSFTLDREQILTLADHPSIITRCTVVFFQVVMAAVQYTSFTAIAV